MDCSLDLNSYKYLRELEDLSVEEGAMPNMKAWKIECCHQMRKLPNGLLHLKMLQRINLYGQSEELMREVLETQGEDWKRICGFISQTSPLD